MITASGRQKRILVVSGSSGGHIFPALSFLESLKEKEPAIQTLLLLPRCSLKNRIGGFNQPLDYVSISAIKLSLDFGNIISILRFFKGVAQELLALLKFKPSLVVGFGSISSVPLVLFARIAGIKTLIHEQNVMPGRANRLLASLVSSIALSFEASSNYFKYPASRIIITGNPLRRGMVVVDKLRARNYFGLSQERFTILVSGGSQGSHNINSGFLKMVPSLAAQYRIQIIHLCGDKDYEEVTRQYRKSKITAKVFSFLEPIQYAYSASDLVISRAGATTISELEFFKIPALLVPYPYAYEHQLTNARLLADKGCAVIIDDAAFLRGQASTVLERILNNSSELEKMRHNYQGPDVALAAGRLRDAALALA